MHLRVTVSPNLEAAYVSFSDQSRSDAVVTVSLELARYGLTGTINLDLSPNGKLTGIEFVPANIAPEGLLALARNPLGHIIEP